MFVRFTVILAAIFLLDLGTFFAIPLFEWKTELFKLIYWGLSGLIYLVFVIAILAFRDFRKSGYAIPWYSGGITIAITVPKLVLLITAVGDRILGWIFHLAGVAYGAWLMKGGFILAAFLFIGFLYGMIRGRFRYKVRKVPLVFDNLPEAFNGFKVVQISDIHIGSFFNNSKPVKKAINLINRQDADLVLFTGDFVNNFAGELEGWEGVFTKIDAKEGKLAILGNHDYGDYLEWNSVEAKKGNMEELQMRIKNAGFDLLLNESRQIEKDGEVIDILGVENWGLPPFKQYGDLDVTLAQSNAPFKILMSHDPSHWDVHGKKKDIALTLSGHTHGMQFGFEWGKWRWSPVKYKYRKWAGLYEEDNKYLYVNRGFGYIGYPGRLGIWPEITVFTFNRK